MSTKNSPEGTTVCCYEFDDELTVLNQRKAEDRPIYFYFAVGQIMGTNLI